MDSVLPKIQQLLQSHFSLTEDQVRADQKLLDLGVDSLSTIEFMFQLEDAFGISLAEYRKTVETVADIAALVENALAAARSPA